MTDRTFADELASILRGDIVFNGSFNGTGIRYAISFEDAWLLKQNAGVVVRLNDGSEFQVSVVRSRGPRS